MKYPSKYSNGKTVSAAQFITEIICENKAKIDKKDLHYRFWLNKEWASFYKNQISTAIKLTKKYNPQAIIKALISPKAKNIYSLRAPHLLNLIKEQEEILAIQPKTVVNIDRTDKKSFRKNKSTNNILSKLKELDNDC